MNLEKPFVIYFALNSRLFIHSFKCKLLLLIIIQRYLRINAVQNDTNIINFLTRRRTFNTTSNIALIKNTISAEVCATPPVICV